MLSGGRTSAHEACVAVAPSVAVTNVAASLPPLPPGVVELEFKDFFKHPVGPRGLELTDKLRRLDGKRVRLTGHMVRQHHGSRPGSFLLTAVPVTLDEDEFGQCDELPASTTLILVPAAKDGVIPHQRGGVVVVGTLSVGSREEAAGRVFHARLRLDDEAAPDAKAAAAAHH